LGKGPSRISRLVRFVQERRGNDVDPIGPDPMGGEPIAVCGRRHQNTPDLAQRRQAGHRIIDDTQDASPRRHVGHPDPVVEGEHDLPIPMDLHDPIVRANRVPVEVDQVAIGEVGAEPCAEVPSTHHRVITPDLDSIDRTPRGQALSGRAKGRGVDDHLVTAADEPGAESSYAVLKASDLGIEARRDMVNRQ
jgi:hypothetical protein